MIRYEEKKPTAEEFNFLTDKVGWGIRDKEIINEALNNSLYMICVYDDDKIIGFGRLIGDKTIFLHIHDVIVIPEYQNKKIGKTIMEKIIMKVNEFKIINSNIRVYLGASEGIEGFYKKCGFVTRKEASLRRRYDT